MQTGFNKAWIFSVALLLTSCANHPGGVFDQNGAAAGQSSQAVSYPYGFGQGSMSATNNLSQNSREIEAVAQTGATWLRVFIDWNVVEPQKGQFNWGWLDHLVDTAEEHDIQVLGAIGFTPPWARLAGLPSLFPSAPPARPAATETGSRTGKSGMSPTCPSFLVLPTKKLSATQRFLKLPTQPSKQSSLEARYWWPA